MRKLSLLTLVLLLMVSPVLAQDGADNANELDDIVTLLEHAAADEANPEFTILLEAIERAGLREVLSENGPFTVFAPSDFAFTVLLQDLGIEAEDLLDNYPLLLEVLLYHIVPGQLDAATITSLHGAQLATAYPGSSLAVIQEVDTVTLDGERVFVADMQAANGIVHMVGGVLIPTEDSGSFETLLREVPEASLAEVITARAEANNAADRQFVSLLLAAEAAGLVDALAAGGPFTIFAPTDAALSAYLDANGLNLTVLLEDQAALRALLQYHIVPYPLMAEDVLHLSDAHLGTLLPNQTLHVVVAAESTSDATIDTAPTDESSADAMTEADAEPAATISLTLNGVAVTLDLLDIVGSNGVIHGIDGVLVPPTE